MQLKGAAWGSCGQAILLLLSSGSQGWCICSTVEKAAFFVKVRLFTLLCKRCKEDKGRRSLTRSYPRLMQILLTGAPAWGKRWRRNMNGINISSLCHFRSSRRLPSRFTGSSMQESRLQLSVNPSAASTLPKIQLRKCL
ncbi:hypothetical protein XENTR_v10009559 [Xenopus tropicalis]|nr:hypothetical protein XENTR_v10009559 [Xenopus tropicalis]KAE8618997.1 hypothetical protein XENTR_v10009559 [Xenopus tropicalis]KAE8618998.1 hypothetical protein XENTR_v10009559 [Xenopus tropicalis]